MGGQDEREIAGGWLWDAYLRGREHAEFSIA